MILLYKDMSYYVCFWSPREYMKNCFVSQLNIDPRNLKGDKIIMEARILAGSDVMEAMASRRPCRPALRIEAVLEEIEKNKGILYDAAVTDACLRLFRKKSYQFPKLPPFVR